MNYTISYSFKYKAEDKFNKQHNSLKPEGGILACHRSCVSSQIILIDMLEIVSR